MTPEPDYVYYPTVSGRRVRWPDPEPGSIRLRDVACHLSRQPYCWGATAKFFSLAEESMLRADVVQAQGGSAASQVHALLFGAHRYVLGPRQSTHDASAYTEQAAQIGTLILLAAAAPTWPVGETSLIEHAIDETHLIIIRDLMPDQWDWMQEQRSSTTILTRVRAPLAGTPPHKAEEKFLSRALRLGLSI